MSLPDTFNYFFNLMTPNYYDREKIYKRANNIDKALIKQFYGTNSNEKHLYIVGSIGRGTSIKQLNDLDVIFSFPKNVFNQFNNYKSNGQTSLLQKIKFALKDTYSVTNINADGQVVVINFRDFTVELNPGFRKDNGSFIFPNADNGGHWQRTKPFIEQRKAHYLESHVKSYLNLVHALRYWRRRHNFTFKGILIDTLVCTFLRKEPQFKDISNTNYIKYVHCFSSLFRYLSNQSHDCKYWNALGSNQEIFNDYNNKYGVFISKAKNAFTKLQNTSLTPKGIIDTFRELFGSVFPKYNDFNYYEEFPEDKFKMDVKSNIDIKCVVKSPGINELLGVFLHKFLWLNKNEQLYFKVILSGIDLPKDLVKKSDIYWKVRNVGNNAERLNDIRGEIVKGTKNNGIAIKHEHTSFDGRYHYVECYLVTHNSNVCIARGKCIVPINIEKSKLLNN